MTLAAESTMVDIGPVHTKAYRFRSKGEPAYVFVAIPRWKGFPNPPDEPLPRSAVLVTVGAKDEAELTRFLAVLTTLRPKPAANSAAATVPQTATTAGPAATAEPAATATGASGNSGERGH